MRVRQGTYPDGRLVRWVETSPVIQFELEELIDGLCSHYWRNWCEGDEAPPARLTEQKLMKAVREEYLLYGTNAVWTWCESVSDVTGTGARNWARRVILAVFPDFETKEG